MHLSEDVFATRFAAALPEDCSLRTPQAQQRMQRTPQQIAAQTGGALGKLLLPQQRR
ncbi:hypothetical protein JM946_18750 [Steroidobacter sp. S1-65]|uniref:Uncharacterized protein n=1 Tax=Steroidobacter gossypii TaxID=2805490 RepID=A0ABS1X0N8_9GAMM|nr:hypothetical protein [Steroidobacter gossypii]MBM0106777.1 hypothetical protein [Steroidobacter gossypii]